MRRYNYSGNNKLSVLVKSAVRDVQTDCLIIVNGFIAVYLSISHDWWFVLDLIEIIVTQIGSN